MCLGRGKIVELGLLRNEVRGNSCFDGKRENSLELIQEGASNYVSFHVSGRTDGQEFGSGWIQYTYILTNTRDRDDTTTTDGLSLLVMG